MLRSYKIRLYPTDEQKVKLAQHFGCARWVYNWGLAKKVEAWKERKENVGRFELQGQLLAATNIKQFALHPLQGGIPTDRRELTRGESSNGSSSNHESH